MTKTVELIYVKVDIKPNISQQDEYTVNGFQSLLACNQQKRYTDIDGIYRSNEPHMCGTILVLTQLCSVINAGRGSCLPCFEFNYDGQI